MSLRLLVRSVCTLTVFFSCLSAGIAEEAAAPDFNKQIAPILAKYCTACHAADEPEGKLALDSYDGLLKGGERGVPIVPGQGDQSRLVRVLTGASEPAMPPDDSEKPSAEEIALLKAWVDAGAEGPSGAAPDPTILITPSIPPTAPVRKAISAVTWSPDGKLLAVARYTTVELLAADTRLVVRTLTGHRGQVNDLAFSADGATLAAAGGEAGLFGEVRLWKVADGQLQRTLQGHRDAAYCVAYSPAAGVLATGSYDQQIKIWDIASGKETRTLDGHNGPVFDLAFDAKGGLLATASGDRTVKLWDLASGERLDTFGQPLEELYSLALHSDGKKLIAGGDDNRLRLWNISETAKEGTNPLVYSRFAHEGAIVKIVWSPNGKLIASSGDDRTLKLWNADDVTLLKLLESQPDTAPALAFSPNSAQLAVGRLDGSLVVYDAQTGNAVAPVPPPKPELARLEPRGVQRGASTRVKLLGKNLETIKGVKAGHEAVNVKLLPEEQGKADYVWIELTAAATLPRGPHQIWVETLGGESEKLPVHVDDLPQQFEAEPNELNAQANAMTTPGSVWGTLSSRADVDLFTFDAQQGQEVVLHLVAGSIGSKANALLALMDPHGKVVASNNDFGGKDPLIGHVAQSTGKYIVRVTDLVRSGSDEHYYRLSIGTFPYVTGVYPLSVAPNATTAVELTGFNVPANTRVEIKSGVSGEVTVPIDAEKFRSVRGLKVAVGTLPEALEVEPNDVAEKATPTTAPMTVGGRIRPGDGQTSDADLFRFESKAGQVWIVETDAARRGSPIDTRIEVLHADGRPVERMLLHAVRDSNIDFRGIDSNSRDVRLKNWEEMQLNEYLYLNGEVSKLFRAPQGPDSGFVLYESGGKRKTYFDTSAVVHAVFEPAYIVEPHPIGANLPANGLPVFTLTYTNDDDGDRKLSRDSRVTFTTPADGAYLVRVTDAAGQSGDRYAYRLTIRPPQPSFNVTLQGANPTVGTGSGKEFTAVVDRIDGFEGEIKVDIGGTLPPGFVVSTPLVIQAGHKEAKGTLYAAADAPQPTEANWSHSKVTATAKVGDQEVIKDVNNLGKIALADKPKLTVQLLPDTGATQPVPGQTPEVTIAPGSSVTAMITVERNGFEGRVELNVNNLPHGIIVDNIGLNGVLVREKETTRQIFLTAAPWVPETSRLCHAITGAEGGQSSAPLMLHVRKNPVGATAAVAP